MGEKENPNTIPETRGRQPLNPVPTRVAGSPVPGRVVLDKCPDTNGGSNAS